MLARKNTSLLWHHFEKDDTSDKAVCNKCKDKLSYKSTTSNLRSHLKRKHLAVYMSMSQEENQSVSLPRNPEYLPSTSAASAPAPPLTAEPAPAVSAPVPAVSAPAPAVSAPSQPKRQRVIETYIPKKISVDQKKQIDSDLLDLCIDGFHPFSIVEERSFKKYSRWIPGYNLPTRKTLSGSLLQECYNKTEQTIKTKVKEEAKSICLTADLWTSRISESYIALTGHYIREDFEVQTVLLGCCQFLGHHTAANISSELGAIIDTWNLREKVNFSVSDNGANIVKAMKEYQGWKHFGCFAHTLNLIVEDAIKICQYQIENIKKIVAHLKRSSISSERLAKYQLQQNKEPKRPLQDVETRWNSKYYMLKRIVEIKEAVISTVALADRDLPTISSDDWTTFEQLCQVLEPFEEVTRTMSGQKYLTGSYVIIMTRCLTECCNKIIEKGGITTDVADVVLFLKSGIAERFRNIEQSGTFSLCTFMDPRFKMQGFANQTEAIKTKDRVRTLVAAEIAKSDAANRAPTQNEDAPRTPTNEFSPWGIFDQIVGASTSTGTPLSKAIKEVDTYLADDLLPRVSMTGEWSNPSEWWKVHKFLYPNLAKIYIENCNIVATSVPCERMFSKSGLILNQRRTRLSSSKVEKLLFLNVNLDERRFSKYM